MQNQQERASRMLLLVQLQRRDNRNSNRAQETFSGGYPVGCLEAVLQQRRLVTLAVPAPAPACHGTTQLQLHLPPSQADPLKQESYCCMWLLRMQQKPGVFGALMISWWGCTKAAFSARDTGICWWLASPLRPYSFKKLQQMFPLLLLLPGALLLNNSSNISTPSGSSSLVYKLLSVQPNSTSTSKHSPYRTVNTTFAANMAMRPSNALMHCLTGSCLRADASGAGGLMLLTMKYH